MQVKYDSDIDGNVSEAKEWHGKKVKITVLGADQKPLPRAKKGAMAAFIKKHEGKRMIGIPSPARKTDKKAVDKNG